MIEPESVVIEPLGAHDRREFDCGVGALNRYLAEVARQDIRRSVASVFVACVPGETRVRGYYTLSAASVRTDRLPEDVRKKMPRYASIPAVRLGRLAVDNSARGIGLGGRLLINAIKRAASTELAWAVFMVDAKDETARRFYEHWGFQSFDDEPNSLFLSRKSIDSLRR